MRDRRTRRFTPLGDLLDGVLSDVIPDDPELRKHLAIGAFRAAVGPTVADRCRVLGQQGRTLAVAVDSPRWHGELQRMAPEILRRVNDALPSPARLAAIEFKLNT